VARDEDLVEEMRAYYEARAPWHDEYMGYTDNESMEELLRPIVDAVGELLSGCDVLEIACGTGNWTQVLARRCPRVVAVDACRDPLAIARGKDYPAGRVEVLGADAYSLQGVASDFTGAFAADWLSHVPRGRLGEFLRTLHDHLRDGAPVVFVGIAHRDHPDLTPYREDEDGNLICRRTLPDGRAFDVVKNYPTEDELRCIVGDAGCAVEYRVWSELGRWLLSYQVAGRRRAQRPPEDANGGRA